MDVLARLPIAVATFRKSHSLKVLVGALGEGCASGVIALAVPCQTRQRPGPVRRKLSPGW
jgi:hypothetical protein